MKDQHTEDGWGNLGRGILNAAREAGLGVVVMEEDRRCLYVSDVAAKILAWPEADLLSKTPMEFLPADEVPRITDLLTRRSRGEDIPRVLETFVVRPSGERVPVSFASSRQMISGREAIVSFLWDRSAQITAAEALRAKDASFRFLIESAPDGVVITRRGVVLYTNMAAARMLGFGSAKELSGLSLEGFLTPDQKQLMRDHIEHMRATGEHPAPQEYRARRRDGTMVTAEVTSFPFTFEGQQAVIAFVRDVTERTKLQAQLIQADRMAALGTLAAGVAHEINNPLSVVLLSLEAFEKKVAGAVPDANDQAELKGFLDDARLGAERVSRIVKDLKAFSRLEEEQQQALRPVDLRDVVTSATRLAGHAIRPCAKLIIEDDDVPLAQGNRARLEQVLINLLINAAQAFADGRTENKIVVRTFVTPDGRAGVEVRDNGSGIAPEIKHRIFDPFFTTKPVGVGTGLGLSVSHSLVTQMGGELQIDSVPGRTVATVILRRSEEPTTTPETPVAKPLRAPRARLLIVDDEEPLLRTLKHSLQDLHDVEVSAEPNQALKRMLSDEVFDLVLCDLLMPGLTGMDLHERVAAERPALARKMVFMTSGASTPRARDFLSTVNNLRLEKPFLADRVSELLQKLSSG